MRDPKERLLDMLDAIERIEKYVSKGRAAEEYGPFSHFSFRLKRLGVQISQA